jgi:predicted metal-binding membrane protein
VPSPLGFLLSSWRSGTLGAFDMGARHGAWCVGCCWALMASLFALGVMSLAWMAFVAGLIALEKTVPFRRAITYATATLLFLLGLALLVAPDAVPRPRRPGRRRRDHERRADALITSPRAETKKRRPRLR